MNPKYKVLIILVVVAGAFVAGRWMAPEKIRIVTHTVEVEKKTADVAEHKQTVTVVVVKPDGTNQSTTTVTDDTHVVAADDTDTTTKTTETKTEGSTSKVTVGVLAIVKPFGSPQPPVYGITVSRPILGPLTIGIQALTTGSIGGMVGVTF
jgi:hypothetical protein